MVSHIDGFQCSEMRGDGSRQGVVREPRPSDLKNVGAPRIPHGTSGTESPQDTRSWKPAAILLTGHHAQAPAVLDDSRTLPQGDGGAGPAFAGGAVGGERNLIVLDAGNVLNDAIAVRGPGTRGQQPGQVRRIGILDAAARAATQPLKSRRRIGFPKTHDRVSMSSQRKRSNQKFAPNEMGSMVCLRSSNLAPRILLRVRIGSFGDCRLNVRFARERTRLGSVASGNRQRGRPSVTILTAPTPVDRNTLRVSPDEGEFRDWSPLSTPPILLRLPLHRRRIRVFHLEPIAPISGRTRLTARADLP
jgi:hypothetical protein